MSVRAEEFEVGHIPVYRYTSKTAAPDYALILLPGIGGYGGYYPGFCDLHVEKGLEIWAMDPPGHGRSALPRGQFTEQAYIDDVLTLAETASVFGETLVFGRLLEGAATPASRLA